MDAAGPMQDGMQCNHANNDAWVEVIVRMERLTLDIVLGRNKTAISIQLQQFSQSFDQACDGQ